MPRQDMCQEQRERQMRRARTGSKKKNTNRKSPEHILAEKLVALRKGATTPFVATQMTGGFWVLAALPKLPLSHINQLERSELWIGYKEPGEQYLDSDGNLNVEWDFEHEIQSPYGELLWTEKGVLGRISNLLQCEAIRKATPVNLVEVIMAREKPFQQ